MIIGAKNGGRKTNGWKRELTSAVIAALVSSTVFGVFVKFYLDQHLDELRSTRQWNESALVEIIGPAMMHFARTESIAVRYGTSPEQLFRDAELIKSSNESMRTILLSKGYLLPSSLHKSSHCLMTHYDIWLQRYYAKLEEFQVKHGRQPKILENFDVGSAGRDDPECGDFPDKAPEEFAATFNKLRGDLYGTK
jgi:hypothetical protein